MRIPIASLVAALLLGACGREKSPGTPYKAEALDPPEVGAFEREVAAGRHRQDYVPALYRRFGYSPAPGAPPPNRGRHWPKEDHAAVRLSDGRVMIVGGEGLGQAAAGAEAEIWDPASNRWIFTQRLPWPRSRPGIAVLRDGSVVVAGGRQPGRFEGRRRLPYESDVVVWTPASMGWSSIPAPEILAKTSPSIGADIRELPDGRWLVSSRRTTNANNQGEEYEPCLVYDPKTREWKGVTALPERARAMAQLPDGRVAAAMLVQRGPVQVPVTRILNAETLDWDPPREVASLNELLGQKVLRNSGVAVFPMPGGKFLYALPLAAALFDPATGAVQKTERPLFSETFRLLATPLDANLILFRERAADGILARMCVLDLTTGAWYLVNNEAAVRYGGEYVALGNGEVAVLGGSYANAALGLAPDLRRFRVRK